MIVGEAEVIHHELAVGNGAVAADDLLLPVRAKGLGRDDVIVDRHDAGRDLPVEPAEIAVAGEDHVIGGDPALGGLHGGGLTFGDVMHLGAFMDAHARVTGRAGKAQRIA